MASEIENKYVFLKTDPDFILVVNSNFGSIYRRFRAITRFIFGWGFLSLMTILAVFEGKYPLDMTLSCCDAQKDRPYAKPRRLSH